MQKKSEKSGPASPLNDHRYQYHHCLSCRRRTGVCCTFQQSLRPRFFPIPNGQSIILQQHRRFSEKISLRFLLIMRLQNELRFSEENMPSNFPMQQSRQPRFHFKARSSPEMSKILEKYKNCKSLTYNLAVHTLLR